MSDDAASEVAGGDDPASVEVVDLGEDGEAVLLRNAFVSVFVSPRRGGRLLYLCGSGGDTPETFPAAALVDVGHEDDRWEVVVARPNAVGVEAVLGHVRGGSPLLGSLKIYRLDSGAHHVEVDYRLAPLTDRFTVGTFLPPDVWVHVPDGEPLAWEATASAGQLRATSPDRRFTVHVGIGEPPQPAVTIDLRGEAVTGPAEGDVPVAGDEPAPEDSGTRRQ